MNTTEPNLPWLRDFVLLAAIWGSSFLFMRLGAMEFGPLPTAGLRVGIAGAFLLPIVLSRGLGPQLIQHWKKTFFIGLINSAIPFACFSYALLSINTGLTAILNATAPLFAALIAWLWLKDRPNGLRILGLMVGFIGVAMLAWDKATFKPDASGQSSGLAIAAVLVACFCYGTAASYTKLYLRGMPALITATGSQLGASLGLAIPTVIWWPQVMPGGVAWLAMLALGILCSGLAYILYFRLIENIGPARSITVTFVVPVFAIFYGAVLLNETISGWMLFCGAIIVAGTALSTGLLAPKR